MAINAPPGSPQELARASQELHRTLTRIQDGLEFFFKFLLLVQIPTNKGIRPLEKWPFQERLAKELQAGKLAGKNFIILKSRQIGVTWVAGASYALWNAMQPGATVLLIGQTEAQSKELLERCKFIYERLPQELQDMLPSTSTVDRRGGAWSGSVLSFAGGGRIIAMPNTVRAARMYSATLVVVDEAAYHKDAAKEYNAYKSITSGGGQIVIVSTGNGTRGEGQWFYEMWRAATRGDLSSFVPRFYNWRVKPGQDETWYENERKDYMANPEQGEEFFRQEHPTDPDEAFIALTGRVFPDFRREVHVYKGADQHPFSWQDAHIRMAGLDFGSKAPAAILIIGMHRDGRIHVFDEYYKTNASTEDLGMYLWSWHWQGPFDSIQADSAEMTSITTMQRAGLRVRKANKDRESSFRLLRTLLTHKMPSGRGRITIAAHCRNVIEEMESSRFNERADREWAVTKPDHAIDAFRYVIIKLINQTELAPPVGQALFSGVSYE
jgi:hypothetical protein